MTPEVSRACARVKTILNLPPGRELDELIAAGETAASPDGLPRWARAVLNADKKATK